MEDVKILLEGGIETQVKGIFYVFDSKYYFIYTLGEIVDSDYVQLYVLQVCKEVKNTPQGTISTGNLIGVSISDKEEWSKVQKSIVTMVEDKKAEKPSGTIQYMPINSLKNLKVYSKNKFKLIKDIVYNNFKYKNIESQDDINIESNKIDEHREAKTENLEEGNVIIDYRSKFFEIEDENEALKAEIKVLKEKLESINLILKK